MNILSPKLHLILFSIFLSITFYTPAQNVESNCGTISTPQSLEYFNSIKPQIKKHEQDFLFRKTNTSKGYSSKIVNSIPIKAHIIRHSDGSGGLNISELNNAITNLNSIYADAYMEFFLCDGINYINEDALCDFKKGDEKALIETNNVNGLINIYFADYIENSSKESICGYTDNTGRNDVILMKTKCATNGSSLAHEMGHFFSLIHTHGPDNTKTTELVDGSNCDTDGDGICDTPASPILTEATVNNFCEYTGCETDANGDKYVPDANNIMSYSRKGCRNHFTPQQLARMYAFYQTTKSYLACPSFNANFSADISQTCEESLTVNFTNNCSYITQWQWDIDSDGIIDYTTQNPTHTYSKGNYDVTLTVSNKHKTITKTFSNFIKVGTQTGFLNEEFENITMIGNNGWTANDLSGNGYNWLLKKGETDSESTGPLVKSSDNKPNTYIYAEASGANIDDVTELISPCIYVEHQNSAIEFAYHMFGDGIGELHVDIKTDYGYIYDVIEPLYGSQQDNQNDDFLTQDIDLSSYANQTINIRFRAIRGSNWNGDIALDNIFMKTISVPISDEPVKAYPNPVKGDILYIKMNDSRELLTTTYNISNLEGQIYVSGTLSSTNQPINVSELSSGMYLLTIINKQSTITKKIIK